jgi:hypothetical protein
LRGSAGCSTSFEIDVVANESVPGFDKKPQSAALAFQFKLAAAALLTSKIRLDSHAVAPASAAPYLRQLHDFVLSAVRAANNASIEAVPTKTVDPRDCGISAANGEVLSTARTTMAWWVHSSTTSTARGVAQFQERAACSTLSSDLLLSAGRGQNQLGSSPRPPTASDTGQSVEKVASRGNSCATAMGSSAIPRLAVGAARPAVVRPSAPKKRVGGLLDPAARRAARSHPFQLNRS